MPWARFDDHMPSHRKVRPLSDAAFRLWVSSVCWSNANHTDGVVLCHDLTYVSDVRRPRKCVAELVGSGLWEEIENGWLVHDFLDYNPSAAQVSAQRKLKTARQQRWRAGRGEDDVDASTEPSKDAPTDASRDAAPSRPVPSPTTTYTSPAEPDDGQTPKPGKPKKAKADVPLEPEAFDRFWRIYPRKVAPLAAVRAWNKAIRTNVSAKLILDAAEFYAMERRGQDPTYTKHPATWLNAACWQDEPDPTYRPSAIGAPSEAASVQPKSYQQVMAELEAGLD